MNNSQVFLNLMQRCTSTLKADSEMPRKECELIYRIMGTIVALLQEDTVIIEETTIATKIFEELEVLNPISFINHRRPVFFIRKSCLKP
jgi:hypothetical protein